MLCYLEAPHLLLLLSIHVISFFLFMSHFSRYSLNCFGEKNLPYAFSVVLEFCMLIVPEVKFRCGFIKTSKQNKTKQKVSYVDFGVSKMDLYSLTLPRRRSTIFKLDILQICCIIMRWLCGALWHTWPIQNTTAMSARIWPVSFTAFSQGLEQCDWQIIGTQ